MPISTRAAERAALRPAHQTLKSLQRGSVTYPIQTAHRLPHSRPRFKNGAPSVDGAREGTCHGGGGAEGPPSTRIQLAGHLLPRPLRDRLQRPRVASLEANNKQHSFPSYWRMISCLCLTLHFHDSNLSTSEPRYER